MGGVEWIGSKTECYNPALENYLCDFYNSFSYKGERFDLGEFAIIAQPKDSANPRIGRLMCVYHSYEKWHTNAPFRGSVRWYTWPKDLDSKLNIRRIKFDHKNEVVEDMRSTDVFISLENIQKKCCVIFGMDDEPIHQIRSDSVDTDLQFFCRYKIECGQIIPYFSRKDNQEYINGTLYPENDKLVSPNLTTDLESLLSTSYTSPRKLVEASPITKAVPIKTSPTKLSKYKRKPTNMESPMLTLDSEGSDVEEHKIQSLSNPRKNVRLTPKSKDKRLNGSLSSPATRNVTVKRVLNDSFGNSSVSPSGIPVLTYAVVDQDYDDTMHIKMKFKLTGHQDKIDLKVFPTKLDNDVARMKSPVKVGDLQEIENCIELSPTRKAQKYDSPNRTGNALCSEQELGGKSSQTPSLRKSSRLSGKTPNASHFSPYGTPSIVSSRRRSSRAMDRKSYAEFTSPEENISKYQMRYGDNLVTTRTPLRELAKIDKLNKIDEYEDLNSNESIEKPFKGDELENVQPTNIKHFITNEDNKNSNKQSQATPRKVKHDKYTINHDSTNFTPRKKHNTTSEGCNTITTVDKISNCVTPRLKCNVRQKRCIDDNVDSSDEQPTSPAPSPDSKKHINNKNVTPGPNGRVSRPKRNVTKKEGESDDENKNISNGEKLRTRSNISVDNNANSGNNKKNSQKNYIHDSVVTKSSKPKQSVSRPRKYVGSDESDDSSTEKNKIKDNILINDNANNNNKKNNISDSCVVTQSARPKRSVSRPCKYGSSDESDRSNIGKLRTRRNILKNDDNTNSNDSRNINDSIAATQSPRLKRIASLATKSPITPRSDKFNLRKSILKTNTSKKLACRDSDEDEKQPQTPGRRNRASTPKSSTKNTPTARAKMVREGMITPSVQPRQKAIVKDNTPLSKARTKLHVSYVPRALPCREKEFADILNFLEGKLLDGCGGCMYVSGVPGTGKTATVTEIIRILQESAENGDVPLFKSININGMKLSEPRQSYVEIVKQLQGKTLPWEQAQAMLENKFVKSQKKTEPIILMVDELDILCTKRQDVVYNLLDWPTKAHAQLIVITIANTMDLPERLLMGRVTSRLGLTRLTFQAYTHKQLQEIVTKRLSGINAFNPDAIQLVARKVASVSGDARRALDICRRAAEIAELEGKNTLVSMIHVNKALNAMITQPKVQAIKRCSRLEKLILQAVVAEVERTGVEETIFTSVLAMLISLAVLDGFQMVSNTIAMAAVAKLSACRLLLTDQKCNNIHQRIILNVSADDVYYAVTKTDI